MSSPGNPTRKRNPVTPITRHSYWPVVRSGPVGTVRAIVGPHSPFCGGPRFSLPLTYTLKVIEPRTSRVISTTKLAGREEASAALKLLGPSSLQPVLLSGSIAEFLRRSS
jgi:hypothetical protein